MGKGRARWQDKNEPRPRTLAANLRPPRRIAVALLLVRISVLRIPHYRRVLDGPNTPVEPPEYDRSAERYERRAAE
jgi:hypothetical protein